MNAAAEFQQAEFPASDPRIKKLERTLRKHRARPDALIQVLHEAQDSFGYLPKSVVGLVEREMRLPASRVLGVITFYHFFSLKRKGDHNCLVCTGTACFVKGAMHILESIGQRFHIGPGQVTPDEKLGLQTARCIGACGLAPALVFDDEVIPKVQPVTSTRRRSTTTWPSTAIARWRRLCIGCFRRRSFPRSSKAGCAAAEGPDTRPG